MKPGYQTSEFWITLGTQLLALLALAGVINNSDKNRLDATLASAVTAVFTLLAAAGVVRQYIHSRTLLKSKDPDPSPIVSGPARAAFALAGLLLLPALANAQQPGVRPTCLFCRPPRTDPVMMQLLQQISQQQQQILTLLQQQLQQQRSAPAPQPQIIVLGGPYQQIPLGGPPRQEFPLGGVPRQDLPLGGIPQQEIPLGPRPRQELPLGPAPRQQIPLGESKPPPEQRPMPGATISYQRYTRLR